MGNIAAGTCITYNQQHALTAATRSQCAAVVCSIHVNAAAGALCLHSVGARAISSTKTPSSEFLEHAATVLAMVYKYHNHVNTCLAKELTFQLLKHLIQLIKLSLLSVLERFKVTNVCI